MTLEERIKNHKATWLYKSVDIPNLAEIQAELLAVFNKHYYKDIFTPDWKRNFLYPGVLETIWGECPAWIEFLTNMKLLDRWSTSFFATVIGGDKTPNTVHVDNPYKFFALQIPVLNVEDSYTAFYDVDYAGGIKGFISHYPDGVGFPEEAVIKEIGRLPSNQPAFIDISVPHRAVVTHSNPRVIMTARFKPELFDYLDNF
jgi:hypothetical protein